MYFRYPLRRPQNYKKTLVLTNVKTYIANSRYKMENIQGIILTHVHPDHLQATNEIFHRCIPG